MKKLGITLVAAILMGSSLVLSSCGNNTQMPPESTQGNTQETGVTGTGDLPGTGSSDTLSTNAMGTGTDSAGMGTTTGGTTTGTTTGTTSGTTAGTRSGTTRGTTAGSTSGNTSGTTVGTTSGSTSTGTSSGMTTGGSTTGR